MTMTDLIDTDLYTFGDGMRDMARDNGYPLSNPNEPMSERDAMILGRLLNRTIGIGDGTILEPVLECVLSDLGWYSPENMESVWIGAKHDGTFWGWQQSLVAIANREYGGFHTVGEGGFYTQLLQPQDHDLWTLVHIIARYYFNVGSHDRIVRDMVCGLGWEQWATESVLERLETRITLC